MNPWNPEDYRQHSSQQQKWAREILARLGLQGEERILDIGCGDGKITAEVAQAVPHGLVVGLDSSAEMIAFARRDHCSDTASNLRFRQGDAQRLGFDEEFDWVISFACLHWVHNHRPVLGGIRRALRSGGRVLLQFGGRSNAAQLVQVVSEVVAAPRWAEFFADFTFPWAFYGPEEYRPWLDESGLVTRRLELIAKDMTQEGRHGLEGWFRTTWMPYWQRVPGPLQQAFVDEVIEKYVGAHPVDSKGLVHLPMFRLEVEAERGRGT